MEREGAPMSRRVSEILTQRGGSTAIEYSLIAGLISIAIILGVTTIGTTISANFFGPIVGAL
jgi:Flp pilus assembly pilin Flp